MKTFQIFGNIVGSDSEKECSEDICLQDVKDFLKTLEPNEDFTLEVCSGGGDVFTGIAISNLIKQASAKGNHSTAHIISLAASIASVICSACDKMIMDENAFFMIHLPYGCFIDCNEIQLAKEIETLDRCKKALISFYKTKFNISEEEIEKLLVAETWIDGQSVSEYKLDCDVIPAERQMRLAASIKKTLNQFNNKQFIERILDMKDENKEEVKNEQVEEKPVVEVTEQKEETPEPKVDECGEKTCDEQDKCKDEEVVIEVAPAEEKTEEKTEPSYEELKKENEELKEKLEELRKEIDEPVDKRVSGMQAKMQLKINDLNKDFTDKLNDFKNQLEMKTKELDAMKQESISLKDSLDKAESELHNCVSALEDKTTALAKLNASVNTPNDVKAKDEWKNLHGKDFFDWVAKHPNGI